MSDHDSEHTKVAEYHREQADKLFAKEGTNTISAGERASLGNERLQHTRAAEASDRAHAEATGQKVGYTPLGKPVFTKKY